MLWRLSLLTIALALCVASSSQPDRTTTPPPGQGGTGGYGYATPQPEPMAPELAVGLYRSTFGPVKIEPDGDGQLIGVWVYDRQGKEIVGFFHGTVQGNVLRFQWEEPADPQPLVGEGFLVFHTDGTGFWGKWWTASRDRGGDWTGQKHVSGAADPQAPYGGETYGGYAPEPPPAYPGEPQYDR